MADNHRGIVQNSFTPISRMTEIPPNRATGSGLWKPTDVLQARYSDSWPYIEFTVNYLVVGGGGGGQATSSAISGGSGGGAGGLITGDFTAVRVPFSSFGYLISVTVGAGGGELATGGNTSITGQYVSKTGLGGGGGGAYGQGVGTNGKPGGSGGGAGGSYPGLSNTGDGGAALQPSSIWGGLGFPGGGNPTNASIYAPGGGGGATGPGAIYTAGPGLYVNIANNSSLARVYATGGRGGDYTTAVDQFTGNGGEGRDSNTLSAAQQGSGGVVIFWHSDLYPTCITTGSVDIYNENGYRIYRFRSGAGTILF